jgi:hypothetical protein
MSAPTALADTFGTRAFIATALAVSVTVQQADACCTTPEAYQSASGVQPDAFDCLGAIDDPDPSVHWHCPLITFELLNLDFGW